MDGWMSRSGKLGCFYWIPSCPFHRLQHDMLWRHQRVHQECTWVSVELSRQECFLSSIRLISLSAQQLSRVFQSYSNGKINKNQRQRKSFNLNSLTAARGLWKHFTSEAAAIQMLDYMIRWCDLSDYCDNWNKDDADKTQVKNSNHLQKRKCSALSAEEKELRGPLT